VYVLQYLFFLSYFLAENLLQYLKLVSASKFDVVVTFGEMPITFLNNDEKLTK